MWRRSVICWLHTVVHRRNYREAQGSGAIVKPAPRRVLQRVGPEADPAKDSAIRTTAEPTGWSGRPTPPLSRVAVGRASIS